MGVQSEIDRIKKAKADIKDAIEAKGVEVGDGLIDTYAAKVAEISTGAVAPQNSITRSFKALSGMIMANNFVKIINGDGSYNVETLSADSYSNVAGISHYASRWGSPTAETQKSTICWVSDSEFLSFSVAYIDDDMMGDSSNNSYSLTVKLMEIAQDGSLSLKKDMGTTQVPSFYWSSNECAVAYLGHNKLAWVSKSYTVSGKNPVLIYDLDFTNGSMTHSSSIEVMGDNMTLDVASSTSDSLMLAITESVKSGDTITAYNISLVKIATTSHGVVQKTTRPAVISSWQDINNGYPRYYATGLATASDGTTLLRWETYTHNSSTYTDTYTDTIYVYDFDNDRGIDNRDIDLDGANAMGGQFVVFSIGDEDYLYSTASMAGSGTTVHDLWRCEISGETGLTLTPIDLSAMNLPTGYSSIFVTQIANKFAYNVVNWDNWENAFMLYSVVDNALVSFKKLTVEASPTEIDGVTMEPTIDTSVGRWLSSSGCLMTRNERTIVPLEYSGRGGAIGDTAGAHWNSVVAFTPGESKIALSDTEIDGVTGTDCSASDAGEVFVLER